MAQLRNVRNLIFIWKIKNPLYCG